MHSILAPETEAHFRARLKACRGDLALADAPPHDAAHLKAAQAGLARLMAEALRECALIAGSAREEDLLALGFTRPEIERYGAEARGRAAMTETRLVRSAA